MYLQQVYWFSCLYRSSYIDPCVFTVAGLLVPRVFTAGILVLRVFTEAGILVPPVVTVEVILVLRVFTEAC